MYRLEYDDVLNFIKSFGPCVVNDIRKKFNIDSIIIGAYLSDLTKRKLVKITNIKKGTSPFYYLPGQEEQIEKCMEYLHEKDRDTVDWLKKMKVVDDSALDLFKKVSIRKLIDFAIPLKARTKSGEQILFWRYYLFPEEEAISYLKNLNSQEQNKPAVVNNEKVIEEVIEEINDEKVNDLKIVSENITAEVQENIPEIIKEEIYQEVIKDVKENNVEDNKKEVQEEIKEIPVKHFEQKKLNQIPQTNDEEKDFEKTPFYEKIISYFNQKNILVLKEFQISKGKEYEFVILVPSSIGNLQMLARVKDKKKLNEGDVAPMFLSAKMKNLGAFFLTTGDFTKKSLSLIQKDYLGLILDKF